MRKPTIYEVSCKDWTRAAVLLGLEKDPCIVEAVRDLEGKP
jgi:hypothetical protein